MSADDTAEMPEQWQNLFETTDDIGVVLALEDLGYDPEDYEDLGEEARNELTRVATEYNQIQNEYQRRDELDREMANELNERANTLENRIDDIIGPSQQSIIDKWLGGATAIGWVTNRSIRLFQDRNNREKRELVDHNKRKTLLGAGALLAGDYANVMPGDKNCGGGARIFSEPSGDVDAGGTYGSQGCQTEGVVPSSNQSRDILQASINDTNEIGNYLEGLTRREREEWSTLWNVYDQESSEFFSDQDINLNGIDVRLRESPDASSGYRLDSEINGNQDYSDWQEFEHDETARDALEYFGELE